MITLTRQSLIGVYTAFFRPHFDYGEIICKVTALLFTKNQKLYNTTVALAITGVLRSTNKKTFLID